MLYRSLAVFFLLNILNFKIAFGQNPERVNFGRITESDFAGRNWVLRKSGRPPVWYRVNRQGEGTVVTVEDGQFCLGRTRPCIALDEWTDNWLGTSYTPQVINSFEGRRREIAQSVFDRRATIANSTTVQPNKAATPSVPTPGGQGGISQPTHFNNGQPVPPSGIAGHVTQGPIARPLAVGKFENWKGQFNQWGPAQIPTLLTLLQANTLKKGDAEDREVGILDKNWKCVNSENEEISVKLFLVKKPDDSEGKPRVALHLTKLEKEISAEELVAIKATKALTLNPRDPLKLETQGALWGAKTNPEGELSTNLKEFHLKVKGSTDGSPAEYVLKYIESGVTFLCKKVLPTQQPAAGNPGSVTTPNAQPPIAVPPGHMKGSPESGGSYD